METLAKKRRRKAKRRGGKRRGRKGGVLLGLVGAFAFALLGFALMAANVKPVFVKVLDPALAQAVPELHAHMKYSDDVELSLTGALVLRDVSMKFDRPDDRYARHARATAKRLDVRFNLAHMLLFLAGRRGCPTVTAVSSPELHLFWSRNTPLASDGSSAAPAAESLLKSADFAVLAGPKIKVGKLVLHSPDGEVFALSKFSSRFRKDELRIEAAEFESAKLPRVSGIRGEVGVSAERLSVKSFRCAAFGGTAEARGEVPLRGNPVAHLRIAARGIDLAAALRFFLPSRAEISGKVDASFDAAAPLLHPSRFAADGEVAVSDLRVAGLAVQKEKLVQRMAPEFAELSFDKAVLRNVRASKDSVAWRSMAGTGPQFDFSGRGRTDLDGNFALSMNATLHPATVKRLPATTRIGLKSGKAPGTKTVEVRLAGNLEKQTVVNQKELVRQGIRNAVQFWK